MAKSKGPPPPAGVVGPPEKGHSSGGQTDRQGKSKREKINPQFPHASSSPPVQEGFQGRTRLSTQAQICPTANQ